MFANLPSRSEETIANEQVTGFVHHKLVTTAKCLIL